MHLHFLKIKKNLTHKFVTNNNQFMNSISHILFLRILLGNQTASSSRTKYNIRMLVMTYTCVLKNTFECIYNFWYTFFDLRDIANIDLVILSATGRERVGEERVGLGGVELERLSRIGDSDDTFAEF